MSIGEETLKFEELTVDGGKVYRDCIVTDTDAEGFLIRHSGGMARISFFDVDDEIQKHFEFDPVEALRVYKIRKESERVRRKQMLLEAEKWKAAQARKRAKEEQAELARKTWAPVVATVVHETDLGLFVKASRITYLPTKVKSTLGFEREGPPKRVLKPFSQDIIFLPDQNSSDLKDSTWKGFVEPSSRETIQYPGNAAKSVRVHLAVPQQ